MISIRPVDSVATSMLAKALFMEYGEFLRETQSCGYFNHAKFEAEIAGLPAAYTQCGGAVLLAFVDEAAEACIAFRASMLEAAEGCEIKRLFVRPGARGLGLARELVAAALQEARSRGFTRAVLDTDLAHMPGARKLYESFGFREYGERKGAIAFFQLALTG